MESIYVSYKCESCYREIILIQEDVDKAIKNGKYLSCAFCNCRHLKKKCETDDLRQCMQHSYYKREHGALRQVYHE